MSTLETVNVIVNTDFPIGTPAAGVVVRIFDSTGTFFQTQATTDDDGVASFTLVAPLAYQVRFFKEGFSIQQPVVINTLTAPVAPATNDFVATGHTFQPPEAVHPRMCRCSGFFRNLDNSPAREHVIHVIAIFDPILFEGNAMLTEHLIQRSDDRGFVQFDLVRCGQYQVTVEGFEDTQRIITIPDLPGVNLPDLMFAVVDHVVFDPPGPWTLAVGETLLVTPTVWTSDDRILPGIAPEDVLWTTSDSNTALVVYGGTQLEIRGAMEGGTELRAVRKDNSIVRIPNPPIGGVPQAITVTPV